MQAVAARANLAPSWCHFSTLDEVTHAYAEQALDLLELTNWLDASADVFLCTLAG